MSSVPLIWSTTPSDNQTVDAAAQWPEGQPASSLNNSARGMMARLAMARDDGAGILAATVNASNVFTLNTAQVLIDPASTSGGGTAKISKPFAIRAVLPAMPTAIATSAPTIVIDGAAAVPLTRRDGTALADGDLTGVPYEILGDTVTSGAYTRARVLNLLPSDIAALAGNSFPIGGILPFAGVNFPTGFLPSSGLVLPRASYAKLWAHAQACGSMVDDNTWLNNLYYQGSFSTGDGSSTFRIPFLAGVFLRGTDFGRGLDPGRATGTTQTDAFRAHTHSLTQGGAVVSGYAGTAPAYVGTGQNLQIDSIAATGGPETRPVNVAYPFLIRAY